MCMICIEWVKNKMTIREALRNGEELVKTQPNKHTEILIEHLGYLAEDPNVFIDKPLLLKRATVHTREEYGNQSSALEFEETIWKK
jgi:hypothetical protein